MEGHERKRCARLSVVRPAIGALATRPAGLDQLALGKGWALATHVRRRAADTVGRPGHGDLEFRGYVGAPAPRTASPIACRCLARRRGHAGWNRATPAADRAGAGPRRRNPDGANVYAHRYRGGGQDTPRHPGLTR